VTPIAPLWFTMPAVDMVGRITTAGVRMANATAGQHTITWDGKLGGRRAKPGRYSLTLSAFRNGASGSSTLDVRLRR
jgi:hypothetical protein